MTRMGKLYMLSGTCESGGCPTVWTSEDVTEGNVLVQGYMVPGIETPDGETMVEVPLSLLRNAVDSVGPC